MNTAVHLAKMSINFILQMNSRIPHLWKLTQSLILGMDIRN